MIALKLDVLAVTALVWGAQDTYQPFVDLAVYVGGSVLHVQVPLARFRPPPSLQLALCVLLKLAYVRSGAGYRGLAP